MGRRMGKYQDRLIMFSYTRMCVHVCACVCVKGDGVYNFFYCIIFIPYKIIQKSLYE